MSKFTAVIDTTSLDTLFLKAHSHNGWQPRAVPIELIKQAFELARMAPTSMNCQPMRLVLVQSAEAKEKLKPALMGSNADKTMAAPLTVIIADDPKFFDHLPRLFPVMDVKPMFVGSPPFAQETMSRNTALQGAYFMLALRAMGLDIGPMSGFDKATVDREFFPDGRYKSNWLVNIGYGDPAKVHPRGPRFEFDEIAQLV